MHTSNYIYYHGAEELHGYITYKEQEKQQPGVLVMHDWTGHNLFARQKAELLAEWGYIGFAIDMYGQGRKGNTTEEKQALVAPFFNDRRLLRNRVRAAYDALLARDEVDPNRVAAIGFCFGGLCVLDLARSGAAITGVVSFHGLLDKPTEFAVQPISAKILALHGYDDPLAKPDQVTAFCQEMTEAGADWQVHMYGHTEHAFTNPMAHDKESGLIYNKIAEHRSLQSMQNFLKEIFA